MWAWGWHAGQHSAGGLALSSSGQGNEGRETWEAERTGSSEAVMIITADMWRVHTEPHAVPSFMSPHSHPERSG